MPVNCPSLNMSFISHNVGQKVGIEGKELKKVRVLFALSSFLQGNRKRFFFWNLQRYLLLSAVFVYALYRRGGCIRGTLVSCGWRFREDLFTSLMDLTWRYVDRDSNFCILGDWLCWCIGGIANLIAFHHCQDLLPDSRSLQRIVQNFDQAEYVSFMLL